jgi:hypothetical protein
MGVADRRRRRRAGDRLAPPTQHPRLSATQSAGGGRDIGGNYRSTQSILVASNAVIGLARERFTKNLRSSRHADTKPAPVTVIDDEARQS